MREQELPRRRQLEDAAPALDQALPELRFQSANLLRDRRLRE